VVVKVDLWLASHWIADLGKKCVLDYGGHGLHGGSAFACMLDVIEATRSMRVNLLFGEFLGQSTWL